MTQMSLQCRLCGGTQPASSRVRSEGWFACRYCGDVSSVPGAGVFVTQGRDGAVTDVVEPGRRTFIVRGGLGASGHTFNAVILVGALGSVLVSIARRATDSSAWWFAIPVYGLVIATIWWFRCREVATQYVTTRDDGTVEYSRYHGGRCVLRTSTSLEGLKTKQAPEQMCANYGFAIVFQRGGSTVFRLRFDGSQDRDWVFHRLREAIENPPRVDLNELLRCEGCGGSLGRRERLKDTGALDCPHCGTGLVYTHGGIHLPPLSIDCPESVRVANGQLAKTRSQEEVITVSVPGAGWTLGHWFGLPVLLAYLVGCGWAAGYGLDLLIDFPLIYSLLATVALVLAGVGSMMLLESGPLHWEAHLETASLELRRRLGPVTIQRHRFPVARLLAVQLTVDAVVSVEIRCSTRQAKVELPDRGAATHAALARILTELETRSRAVGRTPLPGPSPRTPEMVVKSHSS